MKLRFFCGTSIWMWMTTMMDIVFAFTTFRPMTLPPPMPTPLPTEEFFPLFPFTTVPIILGTQGVAAPFDLNPYRTTLAPQISPRTKVIIECPYGFEQVVTPCSSSDGFPPPWPECETTFLKVVHRFSIDDSHYGSCIDPVGTIRDYLGPRVDDNVTETLALQAPVAIFDWRTTAVNDTDAGLLRNEIANVLETELNNLWSRRCADFIELEVTCSLDGEGYSSNSTSPSSVDCNEEWFFGGPNEFTPVLQNGSLLIFYNGTFIMPSWWSDRWTYDVVESFLDDTSRQDRTREIRVCGTAKELINCAIVLSEEEYSLKDGGNSTFVVYNATEYVDETFEYLSNNSIRICISHDNFSTVTLEQGGEEAIEIQPANVQLIYSHVLFAISTLCLVLLIMTYLILPDLRNFQGCAILSFASSLLISQICLQYVAPYALRTTPLCQGIAVVAHFALLCAFAWMTLLAFDLCRSFRGTQTRTRHGPSNLLKRYARHSLFGWGVPLLLVIVALGLHFTENDVLPLEYGSGRNCWVYPVLANILFFICPIVLSLIVNIILFVITIVNICRTTKMTRNTLQQDRSHKNVILELLIYFKISCLMGFSWLFGLVAALGTTSALWYLFLTVNGLQGISVFLSFGVNARVRKMWRHKVKSTGSRSSGSGSSDKTKKTSSV